MLDRDGILATAGLCVSESHVRILGCFSYMRLKAIYGI